MVEANRPTERFCFESNRNTFTFSTGMLLEGGGGEAARTAAGQGRRLDGRGAGICVFARISWLEESSSVSVERTGQLGRIVDLKVAQGHPSQPTGKGPHLPSSDVRYSTIERFRLSNTSTTS